MEDYVREVVFVTLEWEAAGIPEDADAEEIAHLLIHEVDVLKNANLEKVTMCVQEWLNYYS